MWSWTLNSKGLCQLYQIHCIEAQLTYRNTPCDISCILDKIKLKILLQTKETGCVTLTFCLKFTLFSAILHQDFRELEGILT